MLVNLEKVKAKVEVKRKGYKVEGKSSLNPCSASTLALTYFDHCGLVLTTGMRED